MRGLGRRLGERSRPGDDAADRHQQAKAANDAAGKAAAAEASAKADSDDMFARTCLAPE